MRLNAHTGTRPPHPFLDTAKPKTTALRTSKVLLVPYEAHHVPAYHAWMEDEDIREATASERLTLEEEFEMQRKWREDADKLTFIVVIPSAASSEFVIATQQDKPEAMAGDVNLFLDDFEEEEGDIARKEAPRRIIAEVELMIAEKARQGQGLGRAALLVFLRYVLGHREEVVAARCGDEHGELVALRVKIGKENTRSIDLFEGTGFVKISQKPNYFGELELVMAELDGRLAEVEELLKVHGIEGFRELEYRYS